MEREGGREGKMRRGIVIGGMVLGLLLGCNNGGEDPQKVFLKSVVSLGNEFLNVFTSFGDMVGDVLGFSEKTTKSDVGNYFKKIQETVQRTKEQLNTMVENMRKEGNPNAEATDVAVKKLVSEKLEKIIDGAKTVNETIGTDSSLIADIAASGAAGVGAASNENSVKSLTEGIGKIVGVVLGKEGSADAGDNKNPANDSDGAAGAERHVSAADNANSGALALFVNVAINTANIGKVAKDSAKAVEAVTGADILQAMVKDGKEGNAAKLALHNKKTIAAKDPISASDAKDATIAGGIVLRTIAKDGKFSNNAAGGQEAEKQIKNAAISAVTKALNTLAIAIRKTIDEGLKEVKKAMNINANDTPVTSETTGGGAK